MRRSAILLWSGLGKICQDNHSVTVTVNAGQGPTRQRRPCIPTRAQRRCLAASKFLVSLSQSSKLGQSLRPASQPVSDITGHGP